MSPSISLKKESLNSYRKGTIVNRNPLKCYSKEFSELHQNTTNERSKEYYQRDLDKILSKVIVLKLRQK